MTLETSLTKARYLGNNSAREWPLPFPVLRPEHVHLVVTDTGTGQDTTVSSGYTVTGCGTRNVSVLYPASGAALPAGQKLTIYRTVPYVQQLDLENGGAFDAEVIEGQFDNTAMQIQQLSEEVSRAVKISITSEEKPLTAEEIYDQVNRIAVRAEVAVGRAGEAVVRAENAADRAEDVLEQVGTLAEDALSRVEDVLTLGTGVDNLRATWSTDKALAAGDALALPVGYYPGRNMLLLSLDGLSCHPAGPDMPANLPQYEEVGEPEHLSRAVTLLFDAPAGAVWSAWVIASNVSRLQEENAARAEAAASAALTAAADAENAHEAVASAIGDAATLAATEAAQSAVATVTESLAGYVATAEAAQEGAETAKSAAQNALADVREIAAGLTEATETAAAATAAATAATETAETIVQAVTDARDEAQAAAHTAQGAASAAAADAAASCVAAVTDELSTRMAGYVTDAQSAKAEAQTASGTAEAAAESAGDSAQAAADSALAAKSRTVSHSPANTRSAIVPAGSVYTVPAYTVGAGALSIYLDGLLCLAGENAAVHQYKELGTAGNTGTTIAWHDAIAVSREITVIA